MKNEITVSQKVRLDYLALKYLRDLREVSQNTYASSKYNINPEFDSYPKRSMLIRSSLSGQLLFLLLAYIHLVTKLYETCQCHSIALDKILKIFPILIPRRRFTRSQ